MGEPVVGEPVVGEPVVGEPVVGVPAMGESEPASGVDGAARAVGVEPGVLHPDELVAAAKVPAAPVDPITPGESTSSADDAQCRAAAMRLQNAAEVEQLSAFASSAATASPANAAVAGDAAAEALSHAAPVDLEAVRESSHELDHPADGEASQDTAAGAPRSE
jgi:hypothetical protein